MKKNVVILFGGQSTEHDISRKSVLSFMEHIDRELYEVYTIGITKEGTWLLVDDQVSDIKDNTWISKGKKAIISPDATDQEILVKSQDGYESIKIDVVIPVLHGLYGEDGSVQGLLQLANVPYVGCGVLSSAVSMDKLYTKLIVNPLGVRQAKYVGVIKEEYDVEEIQNQVEKTLGYPVFVKPSNAGSSIGVSKARNKNELIEAVEVALEFDRKVLIEEEIIGREVECAVHGNLAPEASDVGEILSADEFYDFDAKYNNSDSKTILRAEIPEATRQAIRDAAVTIFKAVDGRGLARVDFFIENATGEVVFNEINTFPGFTSISMYPMLKEADGINNKALITILIELAIEANQL